MVYGYGTNQLIFIFVIIRFFKKYFKTLCQPKFQDDTPLVKYSSLIPQLQEEEDMAISKP